MGTTFASRPRQPARRIKSRQLTQIALGVLLTIGINAQSLAAVLYWDGDGTGNVGGGSGSWSQTDSRWSTTASGATYQPWNNTNLDDAWLANTAGTITLGEPITVRSLTVRTDGYVINGYSLTLAGGTGVIDVGTTTSVGLTVNSVITGSVGLTKRGSGNLLLTAASTYTGTTSVTGGTLALGSSGTISAANLVLNGGVLASGMDFTRPLGTGAGSVRFGTNGGGFAAYGTPVNVTGFTGTPVWGSTPQFLSASASLILNSTLADNIVTWSTPFSLGTGNRTIKVLDNTTSTADYAVISGELSGTGGLLKTGSGRLDLTAANTFTGPTHIRAGQIRVSTLTNVGVASSLGAPTGSNATIQLGLATVTGTLVYTGSSTGSNRDLILAGSTGGGVLQADGTGPLTLTGSISTGAAGAKSLSLTGSNPDDNTLAGPITNGSGTVSLTKSGPGRWVISGDNTHSGTTTLSAGTLAVGHDNALGTGALTLSGGTLTAVSGPRTVANAVNLTASSVIGGSSDLTFTGAFAQSGNRTLTLNNTAATTFAGPIFTLAENNQARTLTLAVNGGPVSITGVVRDGDGSGADALVKTGSGQLLLSGANTYTGVTAIREGSVFVNTLGNLSAASALGAPTTAATGTISLGSTTTTGVLIYTGGVTSTNRVVNLAGTTGGGVIDASGTGALIFTSAFTATGGGSKTLTLTGTNTDANTIAGAIVNNNSTRRTSVAKTGSGTWVLSGANTFTGGLSVSEGILRLGANNVLANTLAVTLGGGTLDLDGRSDTVGTLALAASSTIDFGASAAAIVFAASNGLAWSDATLTIANYTTGMDSLRFGANASALTATQLGRFRFADYGNVSGRIDAFGFVTPIPEPAAWGALLGAAALGLTCWNRRRAHAPR